ncbi:hypothetical protein LCGC14_0395170 [marine sediment metagenome]|uniref:Uncharacterized protein n=1 Tax=marine sediment metagenome TaxID=412755 RepID=A0A0F9TGC5_9ZZZZ
MREFSDTISKPFEAGLRRYHKTRRGEQQLFELINLKSTQFGLVPYEPVVNPFSEEILGGGLLDLDFPFPQLFVGKKYTLLASRNKIYFVDPNDWSAIYELTLYDAENVDNEKSITEGGHWEFIDFWDFWILTNGKCSVFGCGKDRMLGDTFKVYVHDGVPVSCGCDHKGRVIFGGFDPTQFWDSTWETLWDSWYAVNQDTGISQTTQEGADTVKMPVGNNFVWWSSIGGGDALFLFFPQIVGQTGFITSSYGASKPIIMDILKKNEQGFVPMPFQGMVRASRPLGDYIINYSDGGVNAMKPTAGPAPTMEQIDLGLGGISNRGAIAGDDNSHVYIDNSGMMIMISSNLEVTPLGYREFFYPLLGTDIIISHSSNPQNNSRFGEYYISNGDQGFYLGEGGLNEHKQIVTSTKYFQGNTIGFCNEMVDIADVFGYIGIDVLDGGMVGLKTLEWVRITGTETMWDPTVDASSLSVAVDYRYRIGTDTSWKRTSYKKVNREGIVYFPIAALDFRIMIRVSEYDKLDIDYIEYGIKIGDKRFQRSVPISRINA